MMMIKQPIRQARLKAKLSAMAGEKEIPVGKGLPTGEGKRQGSQRDSRHPFSTLSLSRAGARRAGRFGTAGAKKKPKK